MNKELLRIQVYGDKISDIFEAHSFTLRLVSQFRNPKPYITKKMEIERPEYVNSLLHAYWNSNYFFLPGSGSKLCDLMINKYNIIKPLK